jgi:protein-disulfide isomerase
VVKATPKKSRTPFLILVAVIAAAGAGGIWYALQGGKQAPIVLNADLATLPQGEGYLKGDPNAPVTIAEFGDFECPQCARFTTIEEPDVQARLIATGKANFRFFDFPLTQIHRNTLTASLAASCAADQGKFWEMHDAIFAAQDEWNGQVTGNPRKYMDQYAAKVGLDQNVYKECMTSQKNLARIQANQKVGNDRGVGGTPTFMIGDRVYQQLYLADDIVRIVDSLIAAMPAKGADTSKKTP